MLTNSFFGKKIKKTINGMSQTHVQVMYENMKSIKMQILRPHLFKTLQSILKYVY